MVHRGVTGAHQRALLASNAPPPPSGAGGRNVSTAYGANGVGSWIVRQVREHLWILPTTFLVATILFLQYAPSPVVSPTGPRGPTQTVDVRQLSDAVKREVEAMFGDPNAPGAGGGARGSKRPWPKVRVLPDAEMLRIVVTGGSGFVGSHLVDKLMKEGHQVTVVDNFFTGRKRNLAHWDGHPNFHLITHDVTERILLEVDQIYHLACPASPPHYQYNPIKTIKTNTQGTLNMLGLAKRCRARMLLASTSEVYGDPEVHPQKESYWGNVNPIGPRACYDEGKRVAETMMYAYESQSHLDVRVARIFNTFGPRMHPNDGRVVSNFIIQALQGHDLTVYGGGQQTRSFQFVDDLVDGLVRLMNGNYSLPVNLGNPDEYTVKDFAVLIKELTGSNSTICHLPATTDDPRQRRPDITLAKRVLGWQPRVTVRRGLERTISYFRAELARNGKAIESTGPVLQSRYKARAEG